MKYILFDNPLTRTLDVMWENVSTIDTSKVSGQDIQNKATENTDLQYLKSITDGATDKEKLSANWNDRSVIDIERYGVANKNVKQPVVQKNKEYTPVFATAI